jgi:hypothetical protein
MNFIEQIEKFNPTNNQEIEDKKIIINYIEQFPHNILLRDNKFAHITSSGFIMNRELDKVLMVHHNIRNTWAWTGGHMRRGKYISAHLHLSIAYIFTASEEETLIVKEDENSGVSWFGLDKFTEEHFDMHDVYLYNKLIKAY